MFTLKKQPQLEMKTWTGIVLLAGVFLFALLISILRIHQIGDYS
jgi:hypothetical protein